MKKNTSLKELAGILNNAKTILIFTHSNPDGDALGSATALCRALRNAGKVSWVLLDEEVPERISFLDTEFCTRNKECLTKPDVCICVDCGEYSRFKHLEAKYDEGKIRLCVDHHVAENGFGDYYYIDEHAAATCEMVYRLIKEMGVDMDEKITASIYAGISTDTGSFQYSNTTAETHKIAAELMASGLDHMAVNVKLYQTIPLVRLRIQAIILQKAQLLNGGRTALSFVTEEMMRQVDAAPDDVEGSIDMLRNIEGVEIAVFLKERDGAVKVSLRAKSYADVHEIASVFGGGGHKKAAGCTMNVPMEDALQIIKKEIDNYWEKHV